jgi:carboxyl-terminal processing protease
MVKVMHERLARLGAALGLGAALAACGHAAAPAVRAPASAPASQRSDRTPLSITSAERAEELRFLRRAIEETYAHLALKRAQWGVDLDELLRRYGPHIAAAETWEEYDSVLMRLLAEFHDAHLSYARDKVGGKAGQHHHVRYTVGLKTAWIENQLIVTAVEPGSSAAAAGLAPGDRILAIQGQAVESYFARRVNRRPWSRPEAAMYDEARLFTPIVLEAEDEPRPLLIVVEAPVVGMRAVRLPLVKVTPHEHAPVELTWEGDIAILTLRTFERVQSPVHAAIAAAFAEIRARAKGLVIDLRGNRGGFDRIAHSVIGQLVTQPVVIGTFRVRLSDRALAERPSWRTLQRAADGFSEPAPMTVDPEGPRGFDGPVVALVDIGCRSSCETLAAGLKSTRLATLVGERTAGTSGAPIKVRLPKSGAFVGIPTWSSSTREGQPIEGVGVSPDVVVPETRAAVARGVDSALVRGIAIVRERLRQSHPVRHGGGGPCPPGKRPSPRARILTDGGPGAGSGRERGRSRRGSRRSGPGRGRGRPVRRAAAAPRRPRAGRCGPRGSARRRWPGAAGS